MDPQNQAGSVAPETAAAAEARPVSYGKPRSFPFLLVLVGPPGSGKSRFAGLLIAGGGAPLPYARVCQDVASARGTPGTRKQCLAQVSRHLSSQTCVVLDRCNMSVEQRAEFLALARRCNVQAHVVVFDLPMAVVVQRAVNRVNHEGGVQGPRAAGIIRHQMKMREPPSPTEGFHRITVCRTDAQVDQALAFYRALSPSAAAPAALSPSAAAAAAAAALPGATTQEGQGEEEIGARVQGMQLRGGDEARVQGQGARQGGQEHPGRVYEQQGPAERERVRGPAPSLAVVRSNADTAAVTDAAAVTGTAAAADTAPVVGSDTPLCAAATPGALERPAAGRAIKGVIGEGESQEAAVEQGEEERKQARTCWFGHKPSLAGRVEGTAAADPAAVGAVEAVRKVTGARDLATSRVEDVSPSQPAVYDVRRYFRAKPVVEAASKGDGGGGGGGAKKHGGAKAAAQHSESQEQQNVQLELRQQQQQQQLQEELHEEQEQQQVNASSQDVGLRWKRRRLHADGERSAGLLAGRAEGAGLFTGRAEGAGLFTGRAEGAAEGGGLRQVQASCMQARVGGESYDVGHHDGCGPADVAAENDGGDRNEGGRKGGSDGEGRERSRGEEGQQRHERRENRNLERNKGEREDDNQEGDRQGDDEQEEDQQPQKKEQQQQQQQQAARRWVLAFPSISTADFKFDRERAAAVIVDCVTEFLWRNGGSSHGSTTARSAGEGRVGGGEVEGGEGEGVGGSGSGGLAAAAAAVDGGTIAGIAGAAGVAAGAAAVRALKQGGNGNGNGNGDSNGASGMGSCSVNGNGGDNNGASTRHGQPAAKQSPLAPGEIRQTSPPGAPEENRQTLPPGGGNTSSTVSDSPPKQDTPERLPILDLVLVDLSPSSDMLRRVRRLARQRGLPFFESGRPRRGADGGERGEHKGERGEHKGRGFIEPGRVGGLRGGERGEREDQGDVAREGPGKGRAEGAAIAAGAGAAAVTVDAVDAAGAGAADGGAAAAAAAGRGATGMGAGDVCDDNGAGDRGRDGVRAARGGERDTWDDSTRGRFILHSGDITQMRSEGGIECHVIANSANSRLLPGGGGVNAAIHTAAGPGLVEVTRRKWQEKQTKQHQQEKQQQHQQQQVTQERHEKQQLQGQQQRQEKQMQQQQHQEHQGHEQQSVQQKQRSERQQSHLQHDQHQHSPSQLHSPPPPSQPLLSPGSVLAAPLPPSSPLRAREGVRHVVHVVGPNMNPRRPNCLDGDYNEGERVLRSAYGALFREFRLLVKRGEEEGRRGEVEERREWGE
ncbi:hypothetical protein CLOM_g5680 [Closterium sp. NIES-68]|nr:hypothetical protein CLOM_g5680 [Closterium sp. NIES-68]